MIPFQVFNSSLHPACLIPSYIYIYIERERERERVSVYDLRYMHTSYVIVVSTPRAKEVKEFPGGNENKKDELLRMRSRRKFY